MRPADNHDDDDVDDDDDEHDGALATGVIHSQLVHNFLCARPGHPTRHPGPIGHVHM